MARFNSKLALVLGLCAAVALAKTAKEAAIDDRPKVICNDGNCYPRVFRPTTEFQEVLEGQEIPAGNNKNTLFPLAIECSFASCS